MRNQVSAGDDGLTVPGKLSQSYRYDDCTVWTLTRTDEAHPDADFQLSSPSQNMVCVDESGLRWIVEEPTEPNIGSAPFRDLYSVNERLIAPAPTRLLTDTKGQMYEIDRSDGTICDVWEDDEFVIAGRTISFDRTVHDMAYADGVYVFISQVEMGSAQFYGFDETGQQIWHRELPNWGFPPWGERYGSDQTVTIHGSGGHRDGGPVLGMDPWTGKIVEPEGGSPESVQYYLEFDVIDEPVVNANASKNVTVFSSSGEILWQRDYDGSTLQAVRHGDLTIVLRPPNSDGETTLVEGIDDDETVIWEFQTTYDVSLESSDPYPLLLYGDDGETLAFELDHETGDLRGQVEGPETDTARAILDEY